MGKENGTGLPDTLRKRELLYGAGAPPERLNSLGERYLEAGQVDEAVLFFHKAGNTARLEEVAGGALEEGDLFTFSLARRCLGVEPTADELDRLAKNARALDKGSFAERAAPPPGEVPESGAD